MKHIFKPLIFNLIGSLSLAYGFAFYNEYLGNDFKAGYWFGLSLYLLFSLVRAGYMMYKMDTLNTDILHLTQTQRDIDSEVIIYEQALTIQSLQGEVNELLDEPKYETDYLIEI